MGRLPASFAGRAVTFRIPYNMPGELSVDFDVAGTQFPDAVFSHQIDKPFEIHRVIPRIVGLDDTGLIVGTQPAQELLQQFVRLFITDFSKNENLMKAPQLIATLVKGTSEMTWEWAEPYTIVRSEGFQVRVDTLAAPAVPFEDIDSLRIELDFQGFLIVCAPPSEQR